MCHQATTSPRKGKGKKNKGKAKGRLEGSHCNSAIDESCSKENYDTTGEPVRLPLAFTEFEPEARTSGKRQCVVSKLAYLWLIPK